MNTDRPNNLRRAIEESVQIETTPPEVTPGICGVRMSINPSAIPVETLRHVEIEGPIFDRFKSIFDTSKVNVPANASQLSIGSLIQHQLSLDSMVFFRGGHFDFGDDRGGVVPLVRLGFGSQNISAEVYGTTNQAEFLCKQLTELLWQAAGRPRKWQQELLPAVHLLSYTTSTRVKLGFAIKEIFGKGFSSFLSEDIESSRGLGREMGAIGQVVSKGADDIIVVASCRDITLEVSVFDRISGKQEVSTINIIPDTTFDNNRDSVKIFSELPYDKHVDMVTRLIERMRSTASA